MTANNNNLIINAWEEQLDQLSQAVCRRIREKFYKLLNFSIIKLFGPSQQPSPVVCQFGPSPIRPDLIVFFIKIFI